MYFIAGLFEGFFGFILEELLKLLARFGLYTIDERLKPKEERNSLILFLGYIFWGSFFGGISLFFFPDRLLIAEVHAKAYLILTPIATGLLLYSIDVFNNRRNRQVTTWGNFFYGYIFVLTLTIIRHFLISLNTG